MSLYNIDPAFLELLSKEEFTAEDMARLEALCDNERQKVIIIAGHVQNIAAEIAAISGAIENMKARGKALSNKMDFFSGMIKAKMEVMNVDKIEDSPYYKVMLHKNKPRVDVYDEKQIPEEYFNLKELRSVSKERIAEDIINLGLLIPGATLVKEKRLVIK
jgi:hypothetical protein